MMMSAGRPPATQAVGDSTSLHGQVALVTGGSRGLGRRIVDVLAAAGAHVVYTSRATGDGHPLADPAEGRVTAVRCDGADERQVGQLIDTIRDAHGRIDVLVNNAATRLSTKLMDTSTEHMEAIIRANVLGPFFFWRHVVPVMLQGTGGSIINLSSTNAPVQPFMGMAPYRMTKVALTYLSADLANELTDTSIAVNAFDPGPVVSEGTAAIRHERSHRYGPVTHHDQDPVHVIDEPILWLAQQRGPAFSGHLVRRLDFGTTWGPKR